MLLLLWEYMEKRLGKKVIFKDLIHSASIC